MTRPSPRKIAELYRREGSAWPVAAATGIGIHTVLKYVRAAGGVVQPRGRRRDPDRMARIVNMYRSGSSMPQVAVAFGITRQRVWQIIDNDEKTHATPRQRHVRARRLETRRCALPECQREFSVTPSDTKKYCSDGCARWAQSVANTIQLPIDELIEDRKAGMTFAQLAAKHGVTMMTIHRRLRAAEEISAEEIR